MNNSISLFLVSCLLCFNLATANATTTVSTNPTITNLLSTTTSGGGFSLAVGSASASPGQVFCVGITSTNFDSLVAMQYTMAWDTSVIQFVSVNPVDMPDQGNFGTNALPSGVMAVSWNADQEDDPPMEYPWASVPDGTVLYEICFSVVGDLGDSTPLTFEGTPLNIEIITANSGGTNIGICDPTTGTVTVIEAIGINNEVLTPVNCATQGQGAINIDFSGGTLPYEFEWSGPNLVSGNTEDLSSLEAGTYYLTMTDNSFVPQVYLDTFVVVGDFAVSIAEAGADTSLNCYNNGIVELSGSIDPDNSDVFYEWFTNDGNIVAGIFTLNPEVDADGTYFLVSTNQFSTCTDTASVLVINEMNGPTVDAGMDNELNCFQSMITLDGTGSDQVGDYVYSWTTTDGNILNGDSTLTPLIDMPGDYTLTVFDEQSGCTNESTVTISQDGALPTAMAGADTTLTCSITEIQLNGEGSSLGTQFSYNWTTDDGGVIFDQTTLTPTILSPGTYLLVVTDDVNMCSDSSMVVVSESAILPPVEAGEDRIITCDIFGVNLDGTGSIEGPNYEYSWTTMDGNFLGGENTQTATVDACGLYTLEVTNLFDGCSSTDTVRVVCDTIAPIVDLGVAAVLTCSNTEVTIDGSNSSSGNNYIYTWNTSFGNIVSGNGTPIISVDVSSNYGLLIEDTTNGCLGLSSIFIPVYNTAPIAETIDSVTIVCGDPVSLNGNGSSIGDTISYTWSTTNGNILMDGNEQTLMPTVDVAGDYILSVTNSVNGCVGTSAVFVDGGIALEAVNLEGEPTICESETLVVGNLPMAASGSWTSNNPNDFFENPMTDSTMVLDLEPGLHIFTWTLSTDECPDYDSGSVSVFVEETPDGVEDEFDLSGYVIDHVIDLLENDDTTNVPNWSAALVSDSEAGQLNNLGNGSFGFSFPEGYFGTTSFTYELCNSNCPNLCDTTAVLLNISEPIDTITTIPNGITPNGDGVNDAFIIPEIKKNPERYPNNEFIVFNRWGDIVYQAKPYNNDWTGTSNSGNKELPAGTYYYVIRLNIGSGEGYNGDVTILR